MAPRNSNQGAWVQIIRSIGSPLGFYVLSLLIVESTLALVLRAQLEANQRYQGFLWMIGIFIGVMVVVTAFAIFSPKNLLYGKEEHSTPQTDPSALKDQIEDLIAKNVKSECLKSRENGQE